MSLPDNPHRFVPEDKLNNQPLLTLPDGRNIYKDGSTIEGGKGSVLFVKIVDSEGKEARAVIKVSKPGIGEAETRREADFLRYLQVTNAVPKVYHEGVINIPNFGSNFAIIMERVNGVNLADYLSSETKKMPKSLPYALSVVHQLASLVEGVHALNKALTDMKDDSIYVETIAETGEPKVTVIDWNTLGDLNAFRFESPSFDENLRGPQWDVRRILKDVIAALGAKKPDGLKATSVAENMRDLSLNTPLFLQYLYSRSGSDDTSWMYSPDLRADKNQTLTHEQQIGSAKQFKNEVAIILDSVKNLLPEQNMEGLRNVSKSFRELVLRTNPGDLQLQDIEQQFQLILMHLDYNQDLITQGHPKGKTNLDTWVWQDLPPTVDTAKFAARTLLQQHDITIHDARLQFWAEKAAVRSKDVETAVMIECIQQSENIDDAKTKIELAASITTIANLDYKAALNALNSIVPRIEPYVSSSNTFSLLKQYLTELSSITATMDQMNGREVQAKVSSIKEKLFLSPEIQLILNPLVNFIDKEIIEKQQNVPLMTAEALLAQTSKENMPSVLLYLQEIAKGDETLKPLLERYLSVNNIATVISQQFEYFQSKGFKAFINEQTRDVRTFVVNLVKDYRQNPDSSRLESTTFAQYGLNEALKEGKNTKILEIMLDEFLQQDVVSYKTVFDILTTEIAEFTELTQETQMSLAANLVSIINNSDRSTHVSTVLIGDKSFRGAKTSLEKDRRRKISEYSGFSESLTKIFDSLIEDRSLQEKYPAPMLAQVFVVIARANPVELEIAINKIKGQYPDFDQEFQPGGLLEPLNPEIQKIRALIATDKSSSEVESKAETFDSEQSKNSEWIKRGVDIDTDIKPLIPGWTIQKRLGGGFQGYVYECVAVGDAKKEVRAIKIATQPSQNQGLQSEVNTMRSLAAASKERKVALTPYESGKITVKGIELAYFVVEKVDQQDQVITKQGKIWDERVSQFLDSVPAAKVKQANFLGDGLQAISQFEEKNIFITDFKLENLFLTPYQDANGVPHVQSTWIDLGVTEHIEAQDKIKGLTKKQLQLRRMLVSTFFNTPALSEYFKDDDQRITANENNLPMDVCISLLPSQLSIEQKLLIGCMFSEDPNLHFESAAQMQAVMKFIDEQGNAKARASVEGQTYDTSNYIQLAEPVAKPWMQKNVWLFKNAEQSKSYSNPFDGLYSFFRVGNAKEKYAQVAIFVSRTVSNPDLGIQILNTTRSEQLAAQFLIATIADRSNQFKGKNVAEMLFANTSETVQLQNIIYDLRLQKHFDLPDIRSTDTVSTQGIDYQALLLPNEWKTISNILNIAENEQDAQDNAAFEQWRNAIKAEGATPLEIAMIEAMNTGNWAQALELFKQQTQGHYGNVLENDLKRLVTHLTSAQVSLEDFKVAFDTYAQGDDKEYAFDDVLGDLNRKSTVQRTFFTMVNGNMRAEDVFEQYQKLNDTLTDNILNAIGITIINDSVKQELSVSDNTRNNVDKEKFRNIVQLIKKIVDSIEASNIKSAFKHMLSLVRYMNEQNIVTSVSEQNIGSVFSELVMPDMTVASESDALAGAAAVNETVSSAAQPTQDTEATAPEPGWENLLGGLPTWDGEQTSAAVEKNGTAVNESATEAVQADSSESAGEVEVKFTTPQQLIELIMDNTRTNDVLDKYSQMAANPVEMAARREEARSELIKLFLNLQHQVANIVEATGNKNIFTPEQQGHIKDALRDTIKILIKTGNIFELQTKEPVPTTMIVEELDEQGNKELKVVPISVEKAAELETAIKLDTTTEYTTDKAHQRMMLMQYGLRNSFSTLIVDNRNKHASTIATIAFALARQNNIRL